MASPLGGSIPLPTGLPVASCYAQLKREIHALITENEELKKLVELMKENQELRTVLQNQSVATETLTPVLASTHGGQGAQGSVLSPGPTTNPQPFHSTLMWDTIEEGLLSSGPLPSASKSLPPVSKTALAQHVLSEGQISEARARTPDASRRSGAETSKKYIHVRLPGSINFKASTDTMVPWDTTLSDNVFFPNDMPLAPQTSPTSRAVPGSLHLPPSTPPPTTPAPVDTQRPPDVRPKVMTRKIFRAADKALTQGATSKANVAKEHKQQTWERIVGEIAFQLDRRILSSVFPERVRLYGFTVNNIPEKIIKTATNPLTNQMDEQQCTSMTQRFMDVMNRVSAVGYDPHMHPSFTEYIVNTYGILRERPELAASESGSYNNIDFLRKVVVETVPEPIRKDALKLLESLYQLSQDDGKPMFIW